MDSLSDLKLMIASTLRFRFNAAAIFNCMFAILVTVTLLGIIFVTRPRQPMHNVPPSWWIPIACIYIPGLTAAQVFTWRARKAGKALSPMEIALTYRVPTRRYNPLLCCFWFSNYLITFVILISFYKPDPNRGFEIGAFILVTVISSFITTIANIFLMLLTRSISDNEWLTQTIWKGRHIFTLAIALLGIIYYHVLA